MLSRSWGLEIMNKANREEIILTTFYARDQRVPKWAIGLMVDAVVAGWLFKQGRATPPSPVGIFS